MQLQEENSTVSMLLGTVLNRAQRYRDQFKKNEELSRFGWNNAQNGYRHITV